MQNRINAIEQYIRATNYLTAIQIYLQDNFLLERPLEYSDIKPRLLGHWGTCPGINFVYAHLNRLIKNNNLDALFIMGPGHGFAALQANVFLEGTLERYYPEATRTRAGIAYIAKQFSWPYGFPSHSSPCTPGVIVEGGELGYALSTAYGSILDKPELITVCVIGDGEAETGPTATAWHLNKLINPKTNGAVLPIVHINEYKISGPTIYGRMSNEELMALFRGYGYEPYIVAEPDIHERMITTLDQALADIKAYKHPVILLQTLKGWTGIKELHGKKLEGNYLSHQVIAKEARTNITDLCALETWLRSYRFEELFNPETGFIPEIINSIPAPTLCMGNNPVAHGGAPAYTPLTVPPAEQFSEDACIPGTIGSSSMVRAGLYLNEVFRLNASKRNFRLFSPDETYSNKLDAVFQTTARSFTLPIKPTDEDMTPDGRVIEMLSEHSLQGLMQGYVLTGRHGIFASYEAFIQIVSSMADQYAKFLKIAREIPWRGDIASFNYILTSSGWRQEHNGFSHQNPGFINNVLNKQGCFIHVYFPPDGNSMLACLEHCLRSRNGINVIVAGKTLEPRWLTPELAKKQVADGIMTWHFASDENPDIVLAAVGDYLTKEALAAITIVKQETPAIKMRFVNIMELSTLGTHGEPCRILHNLDSYFTPDKPVIINFHGYPQTIKQLLFDYSGDHTRFSVHGYIENGSTTTPFDMHVRNKTSRYHLAIEVFEKTNAPQALITKYKQKLIDHCAFIKQYGVDPQEIEEWQWKKPI